MGTRKQTNRQTSARRKFNTFSCHKCKWNGRTDEDANRACVECSLEHIRRELKNAALLDFPTDGKSWVHKESAPDGDNLVGAKVDDLALREMREPSPAATAFPPEVEEALFRFVHDVQEMGEGTVRAFYWLLMGYDITRTAARIGVTKQAVSKNLAHFFLTHPNWRALMPAHVEQRAWWKKLHGTW